ncbi:hypothetical protein RRG08_056885 [Elysia crispata]|uniref:Uncharacterized protein n=1 Tax=Elysia crispata TaxID=231223 RepID=A0AAE1DDT0_9GAST|nr:hypothetical protein RRG08_056885 [Elysia crispata]
MISNHRQRDILIARDPLGLYVLVEAEVLDAALTLGGLTGATAGFCHRGVSSRLWSSEPRHAGWLALVLWLLIFAKFYVP